MAAQLRALLALRISNLTDVTTSPDSQRSRLEAEAARLGAHVVGISEDPDVSASKVDPWHRPALGPWLRDPSAYDVLIFRDVSRVARDTYDFVQLYKWSVDNEVRLICLDPYVDFYSPIGKVFGILLATFAEMEAKGISERVTGALAYMRTIARWGKGRVPFGYRTCPHTSGTGYALEPDPDTAPVVLEAAKRVMEGEPVISVVRDFNKRGVLAPEAYIRQRNGLDPDPERKLKWYPRSLTMILRSPSMRNLVTHKGRVMRGDDGLPLSYGPPLMEDEDHRRLVAELDKRTKPRERRRSAPAPLLGIIVCASCEFPLYRNAAKSTETSTSRTYRCTSGYRGLSDCAGCSVNADEAEKFAEREFLRKVGRFPVVIHEEDPGEDHHTEIAQLEEALTELEQDRYEGGLFRGDEGRRRYREQYNKIETRLEALRALPSRPAGVRYVETGLTYEHEWSVSSVEQRRQLLLDRGARVLVKGWAKDGSVSERLKFEMRGATDDELIALGHDDPTLGED